MAGLLKITVLAHLAALPAGRSYTAAEIAQRIRRRADGPQVSSSAVESALNALVDSGEVRRHAPPPRGRAYSYSPNE